MNYNKLIDHTLLKQDASPEQIVKLCDEAKQYDLCQYALILHMFLLQVNA